MSQASTSMWTPPQATHPSTIHLIGSGGGSYMAQSPYINHPEYEADQSSSHPKFIVCEQAQTHQIYEMSESFEGGPLENSLLYQFKFASPQLINVNQQDMR